jgi:hypothetical protein
MLTLIPSFQTRQTLNYSSWNTQLENMSPTNDSINNSLTDWRIELEARKPNEDKETMTKEKKSKPEVPLKPQVHETMRPTSNSYAHDKETVHSVHERRFSYENC